MQTSIIRSGFIKAQVEVTDIGVIFHAPLSFDGSVIAESGSWARMLDSSDDLAIEDALIDTYVDLINTPKPEAAAVARNRISTPLHTPCPALWAGR